MDHQHNSHHNPGKGTCGHGRTEAYRILQSQEHLRWVSGEVSHLDLLAHPKHIPAQGIEEIFTTPSSFHLISGDGNDLSFILKAQEVQQPSSQPQSRSHPPHAATPHSSN